MTLRPSGPATPFPMRRGSRAQALVELALIVPVMLLLLLTALDLGRLFYSQITVTNAAKEGALVASQGGTFQANQACSDTNTIMCGVLTEAKTSFVEVDKAKVAVAPALCQKNAMYPSTGTPPNVTVTVQAPFKMITPIIGGILGSSLTVTGVAEAQCLVVPQVTFPSLPTPTAVFTANPQSGNAPLTVAFDATGSSSPGATITAYSWSFGSTVAKPSKTYNTPGSYAVTVTVTDSRGQTKTSSPTTITVSPAVCPSVTVNFTAVNHTNGGHPHRMTFSGTVVPPAGTWTWGWVSGLLTASGQTADLDFGTAGSQSVTLTATNGLCSYSVTKTVNAP